MSRAQKINVTIILAIVAAALCLSALAYAPNTEISAYAETLDITLTDSISATATHYSPETGEDAVVTIPTHTGFYVNSIKIDGTEIVEAIYSETPNISDPNFNATAQTYTFPNVTVSHTVAVTYAAKTYNLIVNTNGADNVINNTQCAAFSMVELAAPVRAGFVFQYWELHGAEFNMIMPAENITIKAIWAPATDTLYAVKFYKRNNIELNTYNSTNESTLDSKVFNTLYEEIVEDELTLYGTTNTPTNFTVDEYKYDRFVYRADLSVTSSTIDPKGKTVLSIYYSQGEREMIFDCTGGTKIDSISVMPGKAISAPAEVPQKTGYAFAAWYEVNRPSAYIFNTMPGNDLYLEAHWTALEGISYTVKYYKELANSNKYEEVLEDRITNLTATAGETITYTAEASKYVDYSLQRSKSTLTVTIAGDGTSVVSVYYDVTSYTITLNPGKGELEDTIRSAKYGESVSYPAPTRVGYTFGGWQYSGSAVLDGAYAYHKSITLDAKWVANSYVVQFDSNGGSVVDSQTVSYGDQITAPETAPEKANYEFEGWYLDEACTEAVDFETLTVSENTVIYANWTPNITNLLIICGVIFVLLSLAAVVLIHLARR